MKTDKPAESTSVRTRRAIVKQLKQEGPTDAETLASHFNITAMAVRQHLYALQKEARPMGRPAKLWHLTPAADRFFPDRYAELTLSLINSMKEAFGEAGLDRLLEVRTCEQIQAYQAIVPPTDSLQQRLAALAQQRTEEGYMAEVVAQADGSFLLTQKHCPICVVATACTGLCRMELEIFQAALGRDVTIERVEHILAGDRCCVYRVAPLMCRLT
ncbi:MAG: HTH domain-containing protein [Cyanomargarita calcarea GSE-NOS-MK-12-04C]|jgi:predicted ArsR family transcriptional regulator|uniref:HTH domain-containing protein n=1 Tax=Cyanomargarita calcarea GSE-NOS-MK-12-04C TaxID=2839659 RepID=A0A951QPS5_9CYAN|nr:HTH domain-containing protein [Cyanomargarita calcarea GSE-NOS-MK-12-04C]